MGLQRNKTITCVYVCMCFVPLLCVLFAMTTTTTIATTTSSVTTVVSVCWSHMGIYLHVYSLNWVEPLAKVQWIVRYVEISDRQNEIERQTGTISVHGNMKPATMLFCNQVKIMHWLFANKILIVAVAVAVKRSLELIWWGGSGLIVAVVVVVFVDCSCRRHRYTHVVIMIAAAPFSSIRHLSICFVNKFVVRPLLTFYLTKKCSFHLPRLTLNMLVFRTNFNRK